jgi:hypothetical protein
MKLIDLLTAMGKDNINPKVSVTVYDDENVALITYNSGGYSWIESDLGPKKVKKVQIASAQLVNVYIDDQDDTNVTPDPTPTPDPGTDGGTS